ncbi:sensor histidine kinase [Deinococcus yavapaiensis]|uniref:histidine kinase n=1 Tax=Deinococcus yavapaiensis KR-236 TaxID=694435 RepID=A0A318S666_9DEIO|nr:ATP-binding protein [Deinococcus yavapaiensis]PYE53122.1 PAS domain S-box-containing protein [Deinococcus yavapaiensis KR-236]
MADQDPIVHERLAALSARVQTLEAEVQTATRHAMTLFSEAPAPYFRLDRQGRVTAVNAAACGLLGRAEDALVGKTLTPFMTSSSRTTFERLLRQVFEDELKQRGEVQLLHADGAPYDALLDLALDRRDGGDPGCLLIATDITAHKRAHQDLLSANAAQDVALRDHALKVRLLSQELEAIVTAFIQQLHPSVARAMSYLGIVGSSLGDEAESARRPLLHVERAVQEILALLASMDRHMQMRRMRVHVRPVDLNRVLAEVLKNAQPVMADRDVEVTSDVLPTVQGDSRALYLVLDEYVANALKYTKGRSGARVHVRVHETVSEYQIGVQDNGVGFNMRSKDKLYQLFGRLHPSSEFEGTGVGLVTVRRVCDRFGGRVWAEGVANRGATFWFAWPKKPTLHDV